MSSISAVTFNSGSTIDGTIQVGQLAIGSTPQDYTNEPGGLRWWSSADLESGYIIAHVNTEGNQPNSQGIPGVKVGFWRTQFSDSDFISWAEYIAKRYHTPETFSTATEANIWLFANGYWTSYVNIPVSPTPTPTITPTSNPIVSGLIIELDAYSNVSYPGTGSTVYDLVNSYNHTLTNAPYTILNGIKCFDCNTSSSAVIEVPLGTGPTLPSTGYTYISWARIKSSSANYRTLFRTSDDHPILVEVGNDNLGFWDQEQTFGFEDSGYDVTPNVDVWVQYAVVGDSSSSIFYINGTQVGSVSYGAGGKTHYEWGGHSNQSFGYVANMYLYNRKLSLSEIQQQYNFLAPRFIEPTPTPSSTPTPTTTSTPTPTPSSTPVAPVSSGLELYYDPSNPSSYPGSGTILYDLSSSGVNATIGGSPTLIDNSFTFAGSQSIITGDLSGLYAGWQHSLEIWFNASAIGAVFSDTGTGPTNTSYHTTGLEVYSAGPFYLTNAMLWKAVVGGVTRVGGGTVGLNTWYQLVRVYNGSNTAYAYLNKVKSSDTSITWGTPTPGWYLNFGSSETTNFATGAAFQGKLGVVRLYNRVLSLSEVTQNFDAEKSKYGL